MTQREREKRGEERAERGNLTFFLGGGMFIFCIYHLIMEKGGTIVGLGMMAFFSAQVNSIKLGWG